MPSKYIRTFFLVLVVVVIGFIVFPFGAPALKDYLNEKNTIIGTIIAKLQIIESVTVSDQPEMRQSADVTMKKYEIKKQEFCKKRYFYLKSECELSDLSKTNLKTLNKLLEAGILQIVEIQNEVLE